MDKILAGLGFLGVAVLIGLMLISHKNFVLSFHCPEKMPPGFILEQNQVGGFRSVYEVSRVPLIDFSSDKNRSKCAAMKCAWRQYKYDTGYEELIWKPEQ